MKALLTSVLETFPLDPLGCHGVCHWARDFENGRRLAADNGADQEVIDFFAALHDSQRFKNGSDPDHGLRAAKLATLFREQHLSCLSESQFELLHTACCLHNRQRSHLDLTVQTCFDADRLDLGRVGITPDPDRLCTDAAQTLRLWATQRGEERIVPIQTLQSWGLGDLVASLPG